MARPFNAPDVFRAVSHPTRRRMLEMLRAKDLPAAELASPFKLSKTTISEHLRALRSAGLVEDRNSGPQHIYRLVPDRLREIDKWIRDFRSLLSKSGA